VTYGFNFDGKVGKFGFAGEYATSIREDKSPFLAGERTQVQTQAGFLKLNYDVLKTVTCNVDLYNIDAAYRSGLNSFEASRFFYSRNYYDATDSNVAKYAQGYLSYSKVLDNDYELVDDNEDNDYYVENDHRKYPAEGNLSASNSFFNDGTIKGYVFTTSPIVSVLQEKRVQLPNGLYRIYEDLDGVIDNRYDRNKNGVIDYTEDFMLYKADLPIFNLEKDVNNNGVYDVEEDDVYPDYPYQTGYAYTGNGFKSQGIRGLRSGITITTLPNLKVDLDGTHEQVLDPDIDGREEGLDNGQGKNTNLGIRGIYELNMRRNGLAFFAGEEIKKTWDGIKNDVVMTHPRQAAGKTEVDYTVKCDDLRYYNAFLSNTTVGVTYTNIPNFELNAKMAMGWEKHFAADTILTTRSVLLDQNDQYFKKTRIFQEQYGPYNAKSVNSVYLMTKCDYTFKFIREYRGTYSKYLNILQNIKIVPQYKLLYVLRNAHDDDPREAMADSLIAADPTGAIFAWQDYTQYNEQVLYSVPIVRLSFKIGEKTFLESGAQWLRAYNRLVLEDSYRRTSMVAQVVNRNSIQGYDVAIVFGFMNSLLDYDINQQHPDFKYGSEVDQRTFSIFCKVYAGIEQ
jgi:hypothetical protein